MCVCVCVGRLYLHPYLYQLSHPDSNPGEQVNITVVAPSNDINTKDISTNDIGEMSTSHSTEYQSRTPLDGKVMVLRVVIGPKGRTNVVCNHIWTLTPE